MSDFTDDLDYIETLRFHIARYRYARVAALRAKRDAAIMVLMVAPDGFYFELPISAEMAADENSPMGKLLMLEYRHAREARGLT